MAEQNLEGKCRYKISTDFVSIVDDEMMVCKYACYGYDKKCPNYSPYPLKRDKKDTEK